MIRKSYIFFILLLFPTLFFAQGSFKDGYLFDDFQKGTAVFKNGKKTYSSFNYNMLSEKIFFIGNGEELELTNPSDIMYIEINERKFEHAENGAFYELISEYKIPFYIRWKLKAVPNEISGGYGSVPKTASIRKSSSLDTGITTADFDRKEKLDTDFDNSYYLKINGKIKRFNSKNSLGKLFKGHEDEIKKYSEQNKVDYKNLHDVILMIDFCSQFVE